MRLADGTSPYRTGCGRARPQHRNQLTLVRNGQVTTVDGTVEHWVAGARHRDDGPAVIRPDGGTQWWQHGEVHRDDGPAVEWPDGYRAWWQFDELHRLDGPAVIWPDGTIEFWRWGVQVDEHGDPIDQVAYAA